MKIESGLKPAPIDFLFRIEESSLLPTLNLTLNFEL
jgi:hypothetical protein